MQILTGLFGATSSHQQKWGWYGISCFFLVLVNIGMLVSGAAISCACLGHSHVSTFCC